MKREEVEYYLENSRPEAKEIFDILEEECPLPNSTEAKRVLETQLKMLQSKYPNEKWEKGPGAVEYFLASPWTPALALKIQIMMINGSQKWQQRLFFFVARQMTKIVSLKILGKVESPALFVEASYYWTIINALKEKDTETAERV